MDFLDRPLAVTDVETTGLDASVHEIVEIGLVVVNQQSLEVINTLSLKVKPKHIETASARALEINGYNEKDWQDAVSLKEAMDLYGAVTKDAIFCAQNPTFDWSFMAAAFKKTGVKDLMDYHRLDLFTIAWAKLRSSGLKNFNQNAIAKYFGLPEESLPHSALTGAITACQNLKKLVAV